MSASIWSPTSTLTPALPPVAPISFVPGTVALPGINFQGFTGSGFWSESGGSVDVAVNGVQQAKFDASGLSLFLGKLDTADELTIASAATTDIGSIDSNSTIITGIVGISSFGTVYKGPMFLRFASALILSHSTTLQCPGSTNLSVTAGTTLIAIPKATAGVNDGWVVHCVTQGGFSPPAVPGALSGANADVTSLSALTAINGGQIAGFRNKVMNGKMDIAQRNASVAAAGTGSYVLDRFRLNYVNAAVVTLSQVADGPPAYPEFSRALHTIVTTADAAVAAGDYSIFVHPIEGYNVRDLIGKTFTISFWVRSSKSGIHCVSLQNSGSDRTYIAEYSIAVINTWEKKTITIVGGLVTTGTWNYTIGLGLALIFTLMTGATFQTTSGSWQAGGFYGTSAQVNCMDNIGNVFAITGVQLEVGAVASEFEHLQIGVELARCQRYYEKSFPQGTTPAQNLGVAASGSFRFGAGKAGAATNYASIPFKVVKRNIPGTIVTYNPSAANAQVRDSVAGADCSGTTISGYDSGLLLQATGNAGTVVGNPLDIGWTVDAEL